MSEDILLSDRERAEGFRGYGTCGCSEREQERAGDYLGYVVYFYIRPTESCIDSKHNERSEGLQQP